MTKLGIGIIALAATAISGAAIAADLPAKAPYAPPPPPVWSWTGFYIGAHAGGAWGTKEITMRDTTSQFVADAIALNSFLGGVQGGFNVQFDRWVWGVEAQQSWTQLTGRTGTGECFTPNSITVEATCRTNANWLGTVAGRLGFTIDHALIFVKGGGAWVHETIDFHNSGTNALLTSVSNTRWGWMFGTGVEYAITNNWSAKVEYDYLDFGTKSYALAFPAAVNPGAVANNADVRERVHLVKFGINYRFNWGPVVAKY